MLTEADLSPDPNHTFWKMEKVSILYVGGKKPDQCPKGWRGEVVRVLHHKSGGETDGAQNAMLLRQREEDYNPIELKNWDSKTISGCLKARVGGKQVQLVTFSPIRYKIFYQGNKTLIQ